MSELDDETEKNYRELLETQDREHIPLSGWGRMEGTERKIELIQKYFPSMISADQRDPVIIGLLYERIIREANRRKTGR